MEIVAEWVQRLYLEDVNAALNSKELRKKVTVYHGNNSEGPIVRGIMDYPRRKVQAMTNIGVTEQIDGEDDIFRVAIDGGINTLTISGRSSTPWILD
ncbi:hypothetical protein CRG98_046959 [Punica granatum]|uniref:Uncharacterized protein n=1 Tax=Punica granatum TaxID=22663 RepID=A0A2I0HLP7_PUNGR|nr:hypothetical protein CRG98_046959 [Punica granatum]